MSNKIAAGKRDYDFGNFWDTWLKLEKCIIVNWWLISSRI